MQPFVRQGLVSTGQPGTPAPSIRPRAHVPGGAIELQNKAAKVLPEAPLYNALLELERRVDGLLASRRVEVRGNATPATDPPAHSIKTLRLYLYHTYQNQPGSNVPPGWTFTVYGRILEAESADGGGPAAAAGTSTPSLGDAAAPVSHAGAAQPMTNFIRRLAITLDNTEAYPGAAGSFLWERQLHEGAHAASLVVHGEGAASSGVALSLQPHHAPQMVQVAEPLASLLHLRRESRTHVLQALLAYVERHNLQHPSDPSTIVCDINLRHVFGVHSMEAASLPSRLNTLLSEPQDVQLTYDLTLRGPSPSAPKCVDVEVLVPAHSPHEGVQPLDRPAEVAALQTEEATLNHQLGRAREAQRQRCLRLGFSQHPCGFMGGVVESCSGEVRRLRGGSDKDYVCVPQTEAFRDRWAEEAAFKYLTEMGEAAAAAAAAAAASATMQVPGGMATTNGFPAQGGALQGQPQGVQMPQPMQVGQAMQVPHSMQVQQQPLQMQQPMQMHQPMQMQQQQQPPTQMPQWKG